MSAKNRFHQLVFYLEACESGSMFNKLLPNNINVYLLDPALSLPPVVLYLLSNFYFFILYLLCVDLRYFGRIAVRKQLGMVRQFSDDFICVCRFLLSLSSLFLSLRRSRLCLCDSRCSTYDNELGVYLDDCYSVRCQHKSAVNTKCDNFVCFVFLYVSDQLHERYGLRQHSHGDAAATVRHDQSAH